MIQEIKFKGTNQKDYTDKVVRFKDIKTKYPLLEVALCNMEGTKFKIIGLGYKMKFDMYYNYRVLSTRDFPGTYTTSILLHDKRMDEDDQIHTNTYS